MNVVFGATGQTGSAVAHALLEQGKPVRVVLRPGREADVWQARGAGVAYADIKDPDAVARAIADTAAVHVMNPPAYTVPDMFVEAEQVARAYHDAIQRSNPGKVVVLSSVGAHLQSGTGNIRTTHILEDILGTLNLPIAFLRAAWFMENWRGVAPVAAEHGLLPSFLDPLDRAVPMIAAGDIGRIAAEAMNETWAGKRILELHGPADYSPNDIAAAFSAALGRDVQAATVPESEWPQTLAGLSFTPGVVEAWCEMLRGFNTGHIQFENGDCEQQRGKISLTDAVTDIVKSA